MPLKMSIKFARGLNKETANVLWNRIGNRIIKI